MSSPRFLLYGIGGVYNYGCEAIVRGTAALLRDTWPDATIRYASSRPEDDRARLEGSHVEVIPRRVLPGRQLTRRIAQRLSAELELPWSPSMEDIEYLSETDVVLLIGGDLYTTRANGRFYERWLLRFGRSVRSRGLPYVLWGASVGPFARPRVRERMRNHLERDVSLVACRETETLRYLGTLGVSTPTVLCSDPAFALVSSSTHARPPTATTTIGFNLSPLSVRHGDPSSSIGSAVRRQADAIHAISGRFDADILLIPHVISDFTTADDDVRYQEAVYNALPSETRRRATLLRDDPGFLGRREQLRECAVVLAARMHCAVNAVSAAVPVVFLAYSKKAQGMAKYVYGDESRVLPIGDFGPTLKTFDAVRDTLDNRAVLQGVLERRLPEMRADATKAVTALRGLVSGRHNSEASRH